MDKKVYVVESRDPSWPRGTWNMFLITESVEGAMSWWVDDKDNPRKWYQQGRKWYCKTHYIGGEPVTYRISEWDLYTDAWVNRHTVVKAAWQTL